MADPRRSPPPPHRKPPTPTAAKSPNKRKTTAAAASPANKRPNRAPPTTTTTADIEDTATSKGKGKGKGKEVLQEVELDDIEVYERILEYRNKKGVFPFESPTAMKNFILPWIILCIGNEAGWKQKLDHVKNKFTKESAPIDAEERKEFNLWNLIWGNEVEGGDEYDPTGGS